MVTTVQTKMFKKGDVLGNKDANICVYQLEKSGFLDQNHNQTAVSLNFTQ